MRNSSREQLNQSCMYRCGRWAGEIVNRGTHREVHTGHRPQTAALRGIYNWRTYHPQPTNRWFRPILRPEMHRARYSRTMSVPQTRLHCSCHPKPAARHPMRRVASEPSTNRLRQGAAAMDGRSIHIRAARDSTESPYGFHGCGAGPKAGRTPGIGRFPALVTNTVDRCCHSGGFGVVVTPNRGRGHVYDNGNS